MRKTTPSEAAHREALGPWLSGRRQSRRARSHGKDHRPADAADRSGQRPPRPGDAERPPARRRGRKVIVTGINPPIFSRQFAALLQL